jgi:hypothetical protein
MLKEKKEEKKKKRYCSLLFFFPLQGTQINNGVSYARLACTVTNTLGARAYTMPVLALIGEYALKLQKKYAYLYL